MTIAYFDCFSGISGDMTLGALVDAGVPIESLRSELEKLNVAGHDTNVPVNEAVHEGLWVVHINSLGGIRLPEFDAAAWGPGRSWRR